MLLTDFLGTTQVLDHPTRVFDGHAAVSTTSDGRRLAHARLDRIRTDGTDGISVTWTVAADAELRTVLASGTTRPDREGRIAVDLTGLLRLLADDHHEVHVGFEALGACSPVCRASARTGVAPISRRVVGSPPPRRGRGGPGRGGSTG